MGEYDRLKELIKSAWSLTEEVDDDSFWIEARNQAVLDPYFKPRLKLAFDLKISLKQERLMKLTERLKWVKPDTFGWWICQLFNSRLMVNQQQYEQLMEEVFLLTETIAEWEQLRQQARRMKLL